MEPHISQKRPHSNPRLRPGVLPFLSLKVAPRTNLQHSPTSQEPVTSLELSLQQPCLETSHEE